MSTFIHAVFKDESRQFSESLYLKLLQVFQVYTVSSVSLHTLKRIQYSVPPNCFFFFQEAGVPQTDGPPLSIFSSTSKCATVELGKSLFFAKFFGQSAFLARLGVPPCFFLLQEAGAPSLVRHLSLICFLTSNCATKACVPADGGNCVLLSLCLSGF